MNTSSKKLILASRSPRRREILISAGIIPNVISVDTEERFTDQSPEENATSLAIKKVKALLSPAYASRFILGADTFIEKNGVLYGKPSDETEALSYITDFQNSWHNVITGFAIYCPLEDTIHSGYDITEVHFSALEKNEIYEYLKTGDWKSVAGGYRIQGIAARYIDEIRGSYHNVMGLPIHRIYGTLNRLKFFNQPQG